MYGYNLGLAKAKVSESIPAAPSNVVLPSLVGNGAVGSVVTCSPGAWLGSPSPTFTFNFKLNTVSVQSGSSNTYTPLIGDDTKTLTCTVTATNTEGSANADTSNSLVIGTVPNNTVAPVISGTNTFGSTLTTTNGTFTGSAPLTYTYQWLRGGSPISGETLSTYVIGASDSLAAITCEVRATNTYGFDSEVSNTITVQDFAPINTVAPTVSPSGTQVTNTLITANDGTWSGVAPITYEYKWTRNGIAISGATASTYTIQLADDGTTIRVEVKGTNTYGTSAFVASSNSVSAINAIAPTNSVAPVISGTAVVDQTLTSTTGTWSGTPTPTYSYQWKRGATNIGTNSSTYTLVQADAGNTSNITCVVTATNTGGSANATSNQIAQVLTVRTNSFLTASAISDTTIRGALNTLDVGLITNSLDTKMKALYPFVGGTASTHKFNFMNAADTNAAFRLTFSGTWVHSSNGALPNGTNAYADTYLDTSLSLSTPSHLSYYTRTNGNTGLDQVDIGVSNFWLSLWYKASGLDAILARNQTLSVLLNGGAVTNSRGFGITTKIGTTSKIFKNATQLTSATDTGTTYPSLSVYLGALNVGTPNLYSNRECSFATIGDGLTDIESNNLYTLTQQFQTNLGRSVGPQVVSDPDAQAFVTAADIQDQVQADAVNNLCISMKAQGLWTKMKAVYPMVGGTAAQHKFNLKNPLDTNAAFRLTFSGTLIHSNTGINTNGTNGYYDTNFNCTTSGSLNNQSLGVYIRTNLDGPSGGEMDYGTEFTSGALIQIYSKIAGGVGQSTIMRVNDNGAVFVTNTNSQGFYAASRLSSTNFLQQKNSTITTTSISSVSLPTGKILGFKNTTIYTPREQAFAFIGDGLTNTELTNYYTIVQAYQTTLGRQV